MKKNFSHKRRWPTEKISQKPKNRNTVFYNILKNRNSMNAQILNTEVMNENQSTMEEKMEVLTPATIEPNESKVSMEQVLHELESGKIVDFSAIVKNGYKLAFVKELMERKEEYIKTLKKSIARYKAVLTPIEVLPAPKMKDLTLVDKDGNCIPEADKARTIVITSGEQNVLAYLEYTEANPEENVSCKMYYAQVPEDMSIRDFLIEKGLLNKAPNRKDIENMVLLYFPAETTTMKKCREVKKEIHLPISVIHAVWGKKRPSLKELRDTLLNNSLSEEMKIDTDKFDKSKEVLEALKVGVGEYPTLYKAAVKTFREVSVDASFDTKENPYSIFLKTLKEEKLKQIVQTEDENSRQELFKTAYADFSAKYTKNRENYETIARQATTDFNKRKKATVKKSSQPKPTIA
ncbi:hypothetical protein [Culturomica massiliensis]|uniref:hypothetical protein n=1 Tax=Culturomica massiliensis TaxID=1841857 RepID=UPI000E55FB22|nr:MULTISPECIES: hypothetical protein [Odoribacteraceae]